MTPSTSAETPEEGKHTNPSTLCEFCGEHTDDCDCAGPLEKLASLERENAELKLAQKGNLAKLDELNEAIAHVWKALGVTEYTGKHISEHVTELAETIKRYKDALKEIKSWHTHSNLQLIYERTREIIESALEGTNE